MLGDKDIRAIVDELLELRTDGVLVDAQQMESLYMQEAANQSDYDRDSDKVWTYTNGEIVDAKTGESAPESIVKQIKGRVKKRNATEGKGGQGLIRKLQSFKTEGS